MAAGRCRSGSHDHFSCSSYHGILGQQVGSGCLAANVLHLLTNAPLLQAVDLLGAAPTRGCRFLFERNLTLGVELAARNWRYVEGTGASQVTLKLRRMLDAFQKLYGSANQIQVYRAPGRVNLIGEHTDYNLGFVLPAALELATFVATAASPEGGLRIYSEHKREMREWSVPAIPFLERERDWTDYPIGVARELIRAGFAIRPANLLIRSTVPEGSGLSSSAALEVSCALAFLQNRRIGRLELAQLCQRAEHNFVGIPSGIMDQYVAIFGQEHSAIELDCRSFQHRLVYLPEGAVFLAVNTMVKHGLAASAYKDRVSECASAVEQLRERYPSIHSLRDVSLQQFEAAADQLPETLRRRARHVITEDARVESFVDAAARADLSSMGTLLIESHRSLQNDYEVSCPELDFLVDTAIAIEGVSGARMTGGGFGGSVVVMLHPETQAAFEQRIRPAYHKRFGVVPEIYPCRPSAGAAQVTKNEMIPAVA
jgi:galactokinase